MISIICLLAILVTGCISSSEENRYTPPQNNNWITGNLKEMMNILPSGTEGIIYFDFDLVRDDEQMQPFYVTMAEDYDPMGFPVDIRADEVSWQCFANSGAVISGNFRIDAINASLAAAEFRQTVYEGTEVWESDNQHTWVIAQPNLFAWDSFKDIQQLLDVLSDKKEPLYYNDILGATLVQMPDSIILEARLGSSVGTLRCDNAKAASTSIARSGNNIIRKTMCIFNDEDTANESLSMIRANVQNDVAFQRHWSNLDIESHLNYIIIEAEQDLAAFFDWQVD